MSGHYGTKASGAAAACRELCACRRIEGKDADRERDSGAHRAAHHVLRKKSGRRLARELHDDLSQQIATLSIAASNLKKDIAPENADARAQSERIQQKLVQLAEGVRRLSHNLHPAVLEYSGLGAALQNYCSEFSTLTGMTVSFWAEGSFERLPTDVALCLYRIAQEALQNVLKHAQVKPRTTCGHEFKGMRVSDCDRRGNRHGHVKPVRSSRAWSRQY